MLAPLELGGLHVLEGYWWCDPISSEHCMKDSLGFLH